MSDRATPHYAKPALLPVAEAFAREARRLTSIADDAEEQLSALLARAEAAQDLGAPGPAIEVIERARKKAIAARAAADTAARFAHREREARVRS